MKKCPVCGKPNNDDWPLCIDGTIEEGGCQICWEQGLNHSRKWKVKQIELYEVSKWFRGPGSWFERYKNLREMNKCQ